MRDDEVIVKNRNFALCIIFKQSGNEVYFCDRWSGVIPWQGDYIGFIGVPAQGSRLQGYDTKI